MDQAGTQKMQKITLLSSLYASRYTLVFDVNQPGRKDEKILYNPLAGSVHIVNTSTIKVFEDLKKKGPIGDIDPSLLQFFMDNKYVYSNKDEEEEKERLEYEKYRLRIQGGAFQIILSANR